MCLVLALAVFMSFPAKAAAVSFPQYSAAAFTALKYGSRGSSVKKLQARLKTLGYYTGSVDGKYGPLTRSAVKSFQTAAKLTVDGKAGRMTQSAVYASNAPKYSSKAKYKVSYQPGGEYYSIKLSEPQQDYVRSMCRKYNVSFPLVLAVMKVESGYDARCVTGKCYGIMQINKCNFTFLKKQTGAKNFTDFKQNTQAGVYMLSRYTSKHSDIHKVLMCYNMGEGAAAKKWKKGTVSSSYSRKVVAAMEALKRK